MTPRLSQLKEPPLLSPPAMSAETSPWVEITSEHAREIRKHIKALQGDWTSNYSFLTEHLAAMKGLGLDVAEDTKRFEKFMWVQLCATRNASRWKEFARQAVAMKTLGLDVAGEVREHKKRIEGELEGYEKGGDEHSFIQQAADMRRLGFDVSRNVKRQGGKLRANLSLETGIDCYSYAMLAKDLREIGVNVDDAVEQQKKPILKDFHRMYQRKMMHEFTIQAASLAELGLLSPNPDYGRQPSVEMPPIKKFAR
jgi:hypothetical protein